MRTLLIVLALFATALVSSGQEVQNGSRWSCGGATVTINVVSYPTVNAVGCTSTTPTGTSLERQGTPGPNSSAENPTVANSDVMGGQPKTRVKDGKHQWWNGTRWLNSRRLGGKTELPGQCPGDDVVSLPNE